MRILDVNDNELQESDLDFELGYLKPDQIFVKHHDEVKEVQEESHYKVQTFYFEDGTSLSVTEEDDPHVKVIDNKEGVFDYVNLPGEEHKDLLGIDLESVIDVEAVEAKEAYDEYEDISRYILYTAEELEERKKAKEKAEKQTDFMETGPNRLDSAELELNDLVVIVSEVVGI